MHIEESGLDDNEQTSRVNAPKSSPKHEETITQSESTGPIHLAVDLNRCQAYAQCCFLAPDVFRLHGEEALWYDPSPDPGQQESVLRAAAACPVQAITVEVPRVIGRRHRKHIGHTAEEWEPKEEPHAAQWS